MIRYIIFAVVIGSLQHQTDTFLFGNGNITPTDPYVVLGDVIVLNCQLSASYRTGLNASYMYFVKGNNRTSIPREQQVVLAPDLLQLRHPTTSIEADKMIYYCYINETSIHKPENTVVRSTHVNVGIPPDPITSITCISDNYDDMECSYCPDPIPTATQWSLYWSINSSHNGHCPQKIGACTCRFCGLNGSGCADMTFFQHVKYHFNVTIKNSYGEKTGVFSIVSNPSIVKPREVRDLQAVALSSKVIKINWKHPPKLESSHFPLIYRLTYRDEWDDVKTKQVEMGEVTSFNISSLRPFTNHTISVQAKPPAGGYWSNPLSTHVKTLEDVPAEGPIIPQGSFRVEPCPAGEACRQIWIHWQEIPKKLRGGNIVAYDIEAVSATSNKVTQTINRGDVYCAMLKLLNHENYVLNLRAKTSVGYSPPGYIYINNDALVPSLPEDIEGEYSANDTTIEYRWKAPTSPVDSYTFFACQIGVSSCDFTPKQSGKYTSSSSLKVITIPGDATNFRYESQVQVVTTMAANRGKKSSGMTEQICIYAHSGTPGKPDINFPEIQEEQSLLVQWKKQSCRLPSDPRIVSYVVLWRENLNRSNINNITVDSYDTSYKIENLKPFTEYEVMLQGVSRAGAGQRATAIQKTKESAPGAPRSLDVINVTSSEIEVSWQPPLDPNGVIQKYTIVAKVEGLLHDSTEVNGTDLSGNLHNLYGYVNYTLSVIATNNAAKSPESEPVYAFTDIRAPARIQEFLVTAITETTVLLNWSAPEPPNGPIDHYIVYFESDLNEDKQNTSVKGYTTMVRMKCDKEAYSARFGVYGVNVLNDVALDGDLSPLKHALICRNPGIPVIDLYSSPVDKHSRAPVDKPNCICC